MACFLVPAAEAVITTVAAKAARSREKGSEIRDVLPEDAACGAVKIPLSRRLTWLSNLLWGGSGLLAFEHLWHGEIVPWFPFLSAASNPADAAEMLHEMSTAGVSMAALVTVVWMGVTAVTSLKGRRLSAFRPKLKA